VNLASIELIPTLITVFMTISISCLRGGNNVANVVAVNCRKISITTCRVRLAFSNSGSRLTTRLLQTKNRS